MKLLDLQSGPLLLTHTQLLSLLDLLSYFLFPKGLTDGHFYKRGGAKLFSLPSKFNLTDFHSQYESFNEFPQIHLLAVIIKD